MTNVQKCRLKYIRLKIQIIYISNTIIINRKMYSESFRLGNLIIV